MLISMGARSRPESLVGLLLECHERIRRFVRLAEEVGGRDDLPQAEVVDACERCERYFTEALPLHVADEEQSLLPRLRGLRVEVDVALRALSAQHAEHDPLVQALLIAARAVRSAPGDAATRERLRAVAARLSTELEHHLLGEEQVIFPAVTSLLSSEVQAQIVAELRERRRRAG